jgi:hypothetical protein
MANETRTPTHKNTNKNPQSAETVEVLYQKLGDRWYAFSLIDDDVFVGSISEDQIQGPEAPSPKVAANT